LIVTACIEYGRYLFVRGRIRPVAPGPRKAARLPQVATAVPTEEYVKAQRQATAPGQLAIESR